MKRNISWILMKKEMVVFLLLTALGLSAPIPSFAYFTFQPATVVVGQPDFNSSGSGVGPGSFNHPEDSVVVNGKLIVVDMTNNRVLIWNTIPAKNGVFADVVLGQPDFTTTSANSGGSRSASTLNSPIGITSDGQRLLVVDTTNQRILIWNSIPTQNTKPADVVIGQPNMSSGSANQGTGVASANTLQTPYGVFWDGKKLFVADRGNNRVLVFNSIPTTNNASANLVLGQTSFSGKTANSGGISASTLSGPEGTSSDGSHLVVSDSLNTRVLVWNMIPTTNGTAANVVIGQPDFVSSSGNQGGSAGSNTLGSNGVIKVSLVNGRLYIPDGTNNRVLIYNTIPTTNNASADIVMGQQSFTATTANAGGISPSTISITTFSNVYGSQLFVTSFLNNRLLIFNDAVNFPRLGISSIGSSPDPFTVGRLRVTGNMYVDGGLYDIWKVEISVNGGDYASVANLDHSIQINSTHDPGKTDTVTSSFYSDFEPWNLNNQSQGNGFKADWLSDFNSMLKSQGYLLKLKATNNNADSGFPLVYFLPFSITSPTNSSTGIATDKVIPTIDKNPLLSFKVNPNFRQEFKENIDDYQVWYQPLKYDPVTKVVLPPMDTDWKNYIKDIPSDYDLVRDSELNKNQGSYDSTKDTGNGTYLTDSLSVTYTLNSSVIQVKKMGNQEGTIPKEPVLNTGVYRLRISAIDKHGHGEDTEAVVVEVKGN